MDHKAKDTAADEVKPDFTYLWKGIAVLLFTVAIILMWMIRTTTTPVSLQHPDAVFLPEEFFSDGAISNWIPRNLNNLPQGEKADLVLYGRELITHTSRYLGPKGSVSHTTNGMNCQNCHLEAGTKVYGNNYGSVAALYPKFRERSGSVENIFRRVNDCIERSLNGSPLDSSSREMLAISSYIEFIGSNVEKGKKAEGSGLKELSFLDRKASPERGRVVYKEKCQSCHMENGGGQLAADGLEYIYPPLWGDSSYNDGAGLYRISNFAKYVKYNMPFGVSHEQPQLSDEEAWDVAAFVNSKPRPHKHVPDDWPDISKKPADHPFGPYSDPYPEEQHKYGPFVPITAFQKAQSESTKTSVKK